ncbi:MAG: biotin operon repressor [Psychromonas sp.]|jgi:biotin operon repressor
MQFRTPAGDIEFVAQQLTVAGWTGRSREAVDHHIKELADIGIAPPSSVPLYYRCSTQLLTHDSKIATLGPDTSGEAEPLLVLCNGKVWLGLASDHTDRALEAYSVAHSKQVCPKPVADTLWDFEAISDHLDQIELASWIYENGEWREYQKGTLAMLLPLAELLADSGLKEGGAMLCGTLPAINGVRPAAQFRMTMHDPVTGERIQAEYTTQTLLVVS